MIRYFAEYIRWSLRWRRKPVSAWIAATLLYNQGRFREANLNYAKGIKLCPKHPALRAVLLDYAYSLYRTGKVLEAIAQLKQASQIYPDCHDTILRLAHLEAWLGRDLDVVATISRALIDVRPSQQLLSFLAISALRLKSKNEFVEKIINQANDLGPDIDPRGGHLLQVANAKFALAKGDLYLGKKNLLELCSDSKASPEALIALSEFLLVQGKIIFARQQLRRALCLVPDQPQVLALLAETYMVEGAGYQPNYAKQLALGAAQVSAWSSPAAMYSLAKAYLLSGDRQAALMIIAKARAEVAPALNFYRVGDSIERLSEQLSAEAIGVTS